MEDRVSYSVMRAWIFSRYYSYCRSKLNNKSSWVEGESEVGYAYDELDNSFELPVERLMLEVLTLILDAGRGSEQAGAYHRKAIEDLLENNDLSEMLKDIPMDEVEEFKIDINVLGVI
ncbi:Imm2 family immunity protein [Cupriavidus basilensis]|uniref:Immunity protein Imm2 n=1 Tax=Cupriavidus basilensis TaxID=68895 RepID=A0A643FMB4_9BURK|nr:Imm2 family immunity protein [Cupriavidus basilensis]QOT79037.1 immunity protein Imm2 [Cupriavidus basilensis]